MGGMGKYSCPCLRATNHMPIKVDRIRADIEAIARFTETPGAGATRPTFSTAWAAARNYVIAQAQRANCQIRTDAAGNLHARPNSLSPDQPVWLCGSHIDSVPHGGDYDGVAGVAVALELLRSAADEGLTDLPLELVVFAEEEGPTFGLGMVGSRAWTGELTVDQLRNLKNSAEQSYLEAGTSFGVDPPRLATDLFNPTRYRGFMEVHIEQGPGMWRRDQRLAVVTAIAGRRQYAVTIQGEANHAGATSMEDRRDALAAAAEIIAAAEALTRRLAEHTVITVGRLTVHPNVINVIPEHVEFTLDLRAPAISLLEQAQAALNQAISGSGKKRGLDCEIREIESIAPRPMDAKLCGHLARSAQAAGFGGLPTTVSGALHDAAILAAHLPTAMLFVPSRGGISHNPAELSRGEDIAAAARVIENLVRRPTLRRLNQMNHEAFVQSIGPTFEHSAWIADRAWNRRPFASLCDLHEKLAATVASASPDEQLALIRAHPDLVGRLAREGKLTCESTTEQAAAGLTTLSADEIKTFESHNAAYKNRFGFPFIICARENRKEAILAAFPKRLSNSKEQEIATALAEIYKIARFRLSDAVWED